MECRFIDSGFDSPYMNMAIDEALLGFCKMPTLRIFRWKPSSISIGYNQNPEKELNLEKCSSLKIPFVRRITGGKAVFHDDEITYSLIAPQTSLDLPDDVTESYRILAKALILALKNIGIKAEMKKQPEKIATPICFNSTNWYELVCSGRKISGSAQRRIDGKILQHGPILMDFDYKKNSQIFQSESPNETEKILKDKVTSIRKELGKKISYDELADSIKSGFKKCFDFEFKENKLSVQENKLAVKLSKEKYSTKEWNYRV